jgi:hypothetical protein
MRTTRYYQVRSIARFAVALLAVLGFLLVLGFVGGQELRAGCQDGIYHGEGCSR